MDFREDQLLKTSTNRSGRSTILTLTAALDAPHDPQPGALDAAPFTCSPIQPNGSDAIARRFRNDFWLRCLPIPYRSPTIRS